MQLVAAAVLRFVPGEEAPIDTDGHVIRDLKDTG